MTLDPKHVGKKYGPFVYEVGVEKVREFAYAVGGSVPSMGFSGVGAPDDLHPWLHDKAEGAKSPYGSIIAMPNFAVVFAIGPFGAAVMDPELGVNVMMLVHGEQEFEFFGVVRPGDVMTTNGVITRCLTKAGKDFLNVETESTNQHGALIVKGTWTAVIRGE